MRFGSKSSGAKIQFQSTATIRCNSQAPKKPRHFLSRFSLGSTHRTPASKGGELNPFPQHMVTVMVANISEHVSGMWNHQAVWIQLLGFH